MERFPDTVQHAEHRQRHLNRDRSRASGLAGTLPPVMLRHGWLSSCCLHPCPTTEQGRGVATRFTSVQQHPGHPHEERQWIATWSPRRLSAPPPAAVPATARGPVPSRCPAVASGAGGFAPDRGLPSAADQVQDSLSALERLAPLLPRSRAAISVRNACINALPIFQWFMRAKSFDLSIGKLASVHFLKKPGAVCFVCPDGVHHRDYCV